MSKKSLVGVAAFLSALGTDAAFAPRAEACGGCFVPTERPSVVTDHRMILTVYQNESTLYDQIKYSGSPQSFAWVLPIVGTAEVGLSADTVFGALDALTQTTIVQPARNCPGPQGQCPLNASASGGAASDSGGVTVTKSEVVGPYATVQLKSDNPAALTDWLAANGFSVPNDVKPIIASYVAEHFDFLALKLVPGASVNQMRPVRVTTRGASTSLPLRMVAAGTGPTVGISLWVLGEGRYEPQNFPFFHIDDKELVWDWTQGRSNYVPLRDEKTKAANGRAWEIESSLDEQKSTIAQGVQYGVFVGGGRGGAPQAASDYDPIKDGNGTVIKTPEQVRALDLQKLLNTSSPVTENDLSPLQGSLRITRIRADLAHEGLTTDLQLRAAADQSVLSNQRVVAKELNEPVCPVYAGCESTGEQLPRTQAVAKTQANASGLVLGSGCNTTDKTDDAKSLLALGGLGAFFAASALRRKKRD